MDRSSSKSARGFRATLKSEASATHKSLTIDTSWEVGKYFRNGGYAISECKPPMQISPASPLKTSLSSLSFAPAEITQNDGQTAGFEDCRMSLHGPTGADAEFPYSSPKRAGERFEIGETVGESRDVLL